MNFLKKDMNLESNGNNKTKKAQSSSPNTTNVKKAATAEVQSSEINEKYINETL